MIWRGHLDLPSKLEDDLPRWFTEAIVALAAIAAAVGIRMVISAFAPDVVPFALSFPAIVAATLLAGGRSGLMTVVGAQLLIWYMGLPPIRSFAIDSLTVALNLLLVTLAQLVMLWAVASYRRVALADRDRDRRQIDGLSLALGEIDHRTKNNFQIATSLLTMQAQRAGDPALKAALSRAATRLQAIASVYRNLAMSSAGLDEIRLHEHLAEICHRLREGLLTPAVTLDFTADPAIVSQDLAIRIGLIVNELVTNAAKHAFPDGVGTITVRLSARRDCLELSISDDGRGFSGPNGGDGLGTRLVEMLARQIDAEAQLGEGPGTRHDFRIPLEQR